MHCLNHNFYRLQHNLHLLHHNFYLFTYHLSLTSLHNVCSFLTLFGTFSPSHPVYQLLTLCALLLFSSSFVAHVHLSMPAPDSFLGPWCLFHFHCRLLGLFYACLHHSCRRILQSLFDDERFPLCLLLVSVPRGFLSSVATPPRCFGSTSPFRYVPRLFSPQVLLANFFTVSSWVNIDCRVVPSRMQLLYLPDGRYSSPRVCVSISCLPDLSDTFHMCISVSLFLWLARSKCVSSSSHHLKLSKRGIYICLSPRVRHRLSHLPTLAGPFICFA